MRPDTERLKSHKLPQGWHCPACGLLLEGATPVEQREHSEMIPGHVIVCSGCGVVLVLKPDGLIQMSNKEIDALPNPTIEQLHKVVFHVRKMIEEAAKN